MFRQEYRFWTATSDISLADLLERLQLEARADRDFRKASAPLCFLIARDLRGFKNDGERGAVALQSRPMRHWRQRYNGLERLLDD